MKFDLYYVVKVESNKIHDRLEYTFAAGPFGTFDEALDAKYKQSEQPYNYEVVWNVQTAMKV